MKNKNLIQYLKSNINSKYVRVFFNVQMVYGTVFHYVIYMQVRNNLQQSLFRAKSFVECKNQLNINYQYKVIGYDKILSSQQILKFAKKQQTINIEENNSYFIEQL